MKTYVVLRIRSASYRRFKCVTQRTFSWRNKKNNYLTALLSGAMIRIHTLEIETFIFVLGSGFDMIEQTGPKLFHQRQHFVPILPEVSHALSCRLVN